MALAVVERAGDDRDRTVRLEANAAHLGRGRGGHFQILADAAAAQLAPSAAFGPASGKPGTIGNLYYGSKGYLVISDYDSYKSFLGEDAEPGPAKHVPLHNEHFVNFVECIRSRKAEDLHAPIREGYLSTTLVHLANASYRLGRTINFDPESESVIGDSEATEMLKGTYRAPYIVPENV